MYFKYAARSLAVLLSAAVFSVAQATSQSLFPENGASDAASEAQLVITFDSSPALNPQGTLVIYNSDGSVADTIKFADEAQTFFDGTSVNVGSQLVRAEGNSVFVTAHNGAIKPDSSYYVVIESGAISCGDFAGFAEGEWSFKTKARKSGFSDGATISVNNSTEKSNSADFHSIQAALEAVKDSSGTYTISVAPGTYYELLHYKGKANIILQGPAGNNRGDNAVVEYINCNDLNAPQTARVSFYFTGANLILENLTFVNLTDSEKVYSSAIKVPSGNAQAETLFFHNGKGKTVTAYNCSFKSRQDTLQLSGKCWFYNCYVEGDVDYVWGFVDTALFEECDFNCVRRVKDRAYLFECRVGTKENALVPKGFVLYNSRVNVEAGQTAYYGRRATAIEKAKIPYYDQCAIVNVAFQGEGNFGEARWYVGKEPQFIDDCANVGWKEYNVTFDDLKGKKPADTSKRYKNSGDITKKLYKAEYSTRELIMNRVYNVSKKSYVADSEYYWDLNQVARDRGYGVKDLPKAKKK